MDTREPKDVARIPKPGQGERYATLALLGIIGTTLWVWALVPLYRVVCERIGIEISRTGPWARDAAIASTAGNQAPRRVLVHFTGVVNAGLPMDFHPLTRTMEVEVGKTARVSYRFTNLTDKPLDIQAVHSLSPPQADHAFKKMVCFCFTKQVLKPHESKDLPVVFRVEPRLDPLYEDLTLGYTLYNLNPATRELLPSEQRLHQHKHGGPAA